MQTDIPPATLPASAANRLRRLLEGDRVVRLMGAHNALGAKMAERAGFDGVWSSGLELSASYGVPDASLVTMSEHLVTLQAMCYCLSVPILADCDSGYGDECNVAFMVRKFEAAGVAGVTIEDKCYPKRNSFVEGPQDLAPVDQFVAKILSARAARRHADFVIVARTEALIAGESVDEALRRAHAYADAGADAILFHSKARTFGQIAETLQLWQNRLPVVLVPTTYPEVGLDELQRLGVRIVIYANQGLRSSLRSVERTYAEILRSGSTHSVEPFLWPLQKVFALLDSGHPQFGHQPEPQPPPPASLPPRLPPVAAAEVCDQLLAAGIDFCAGVPDSTMTQLFLELERRAELEYLPAVSEEGAIGVAVGAYLGGRSPAILMQNSGLGTAVTALASLVRPYGIPLLLLVGWRGVDGDDAPEHQILGENTLDLLRLLGIPFEIFDPTQPGRGITNLLGLARRTSSPAALVVRQGALK